MTHQAITVPSAIRFQHHDVYDFGSVLSQFQWKPSDRNVIIDFSNCRQANYQALSLYVLYVWWLRMHNHFVKVYFPQTSDVALMWKRMGAMGWSQVLNSRSENFRGDRYKPLFAIRNQLDFSRALKKAETYTHGFNIEYEKTLRYVVSELLYNTLEHGRNDTIPSLIQFNYYREKEELGFIVADLGVGIRRHMSQAYPNLPDDVSAIQYALKPQVSGTFVSKLPYQSQNNAGFGLYLSSNIIRRLDADMHLISGNGLVHISPTDETGRILDANCPGTLVIASIRLRKSTPINFQRMMAEFRSSAQQEIEEFTTKEAENSYYLNIYNFFGKYADDKIAAIKFRDQHISPAVELHKDIHVDFDRVLSAPHSFLNALLSTAICSFGMNAYKKIKIRNAQPEIRETLDFIMDANTK